MNSGEHHDVVEHPLSIAYFSNHLALRNGHGIARYGYQLMAALQRVRPDFKVIPVATRSDYDDEVKIRLRERYGLRLLPWGRLWTPLCWTLLNWPPIERWIEESVDLVHLGWLTYYLAATRKPVVMTIHDLGVLTHPEFFSKTNPWPMKRALTQALNTVEAFICVSAATANELEAYVGSQIADRISVIHEGVSPFFFETPDVACPTSLVGLLEPGTPFFLTAGKISPRKNVLRVLHAFTKLLDNIPHHLVLVGGNGWDAEEVLKELATPAVAERVHLVGYVSDEELRSLYATADLFIYPSLYEGFGLPILEAMAAGCPVVTSNISSLPEVAGDAALLVDPNSVDALAEAIRAICSDRTFAQSLTERGCIRAKIFTWERCAERVAHVYQRIV